MSKSTIRSFKPRDYGSFKEAVTALIEAAGGIEAASELCRVKRTQLHAYSDPAEPDTHMPVDVAYALERATGRHAVTETLAAKHGLIVLAPLLAANDAGFAAEVARVGQEVAGLFEQGALVLADGRLTGAEATRWLREIDEVIAVTAALRSHVAQAAPVEARHPGKTAAGKPGESSGGAQ